MERPHPQSPRPTAETVARRCRDAGLKATAQRVAVLEALLSTDSHPSPEMVFAEVVQAQPTISRGTVYKTLETLEAAGLVRQVAVANESKRYDAKMDDHHHLVCTQCKRVIDYNDPALDALSPPTDLGGFVAKGVRIQIVGICGACQVAAPS